MLFWRWKIQEIFKGVSCSTQHQQGGLRLFVGKPRHRWLSRGGNRPFQDGLFFLHSFILETRSALLWAALKPDRERGLAFR